MKNLVVCHFFYLLLYYLYKQLRNKLKAASRSLSRKKKGSRNWYNAKEHLNRVYNDSFSRYNHSRPLDGIRF